jgi:hypothetical protein
VSSQEPFDLPDVVRLRHGTTALTVAVDSSAPISLDVLTTDSDGKERTLSVYVQGTTSGTPTILLSGFSLSSVTIQGA